MANGRVSLRRGPLPPPAEQLFLILIARRSRGRVLPRTLRRPSHMGFPSRLPTHINSTTRRAPQTTLTASLHRFPRMEIRRSTSISIGGTTNKKPWLLCKTTTTVSQCLCRRTAKFARLHRHILPITTLTPLGTLS